MPFKKGQVANPGGMPKASRQALTKIRAAINMAIENYKHGENIGVVALSEKIALEMQENGVIRSLKDLAPVLPKDVIAEVTHTLRAQSLTDDDLAEIALKEAENANEEQKEVIH